MRLRAANRVLFSLMTIALSGLCSGALADSAPETVTCEALKTIDLSGLQDAPTKITQAQWVQAKENIPAYCQVQGYVAPQVGFEIRLPTTAWNRKFLMAGCGGLCGTFLLDACDAPLRKGYACILTDMGHKGGLGEALWAHNNLQAKLDFGYRATHVAALAGKAITEQHFQAPPERSYFVGCSTGGRQGLASAQRFPWDFDGIVAGAPTIDTAALAVYILEASRALQDADGDLVFSSADLEVLHGGALAQCDLDDGIKDGIIGNPTACQFDPAKLLCKSGKATDCLTETQVTSAKGMYAGIAASAGERFHPGLTVGSELKWNTISLLKPQFVSQFRNMKFMPDPGSSWTPTDFDVGRDYRRALMMEPLYAASNPDLRRFKATGAKLILYGGWNDVWILPKALVDYYETVERTMGGRQATQEFARLFMLPGVGHCGSGEGAGAVDFLSALENWVERGQAPHRLSSAHESRFTRPLFPYPQRARYQGSGDPNRADSFTSTAPNERGGR